MDKEKNNLLEEFECTAILAGFMIGVGILGLPSTVVKDARQDGWIAVIIGGLYPLFLSLLAIYFVKNHPNEHILILSEKYLGKILGTICNILFMCKFGIYVILISNGLSNVFRVYAVSFLTPIKIFIPTILIVFYLAYKGLKVLGRINKISFYFSGILALTLLTALQGGNYLNICPVFGTAYKNILNGSINSVLAYGGMEAIFLIYPMLKNKDKIKQVVFKAAFFTIGIYTWVTFITIYYLGYKVTSKTLWPVLLVTEGVDVPVLNSFRLLFLFLWSIVIFKCLANEHYVFTNILSYVFKVKNKKNIYYCTFPLVIFLCLKIENEVQRRALIDYIIPKVSLFNVLYISIIALLIFKKGDCG